MNPVVWIGVAVLGGLGAIARFAVDGAISSRYEGGFPLGSLIVNLSGAFLLGLLVGLALRGHAYLLAGTAVLGSYTTFSTWMLESQRLGEDGQSGLLLANLAISLFAGLAVAELGRLLGGAL